MGKYKGRKNYRRRGGLASKVRYLAKMVKRNKPEKKLFVSNAVGAIPLGGNGYQHQFPFIPTGVGQNERVGNSIKITSVKCDMFYRLQDTAANATGNMRVLVYIPKKNVADALNTMSYLSAPDLDQYTILKDIYITKNLQNPNGRIRFWIPFKRGLHVQYSDGTAGSYTKNPLKIVFLTDKTTTGTSFTLHGYFKTFYTDN